MVNIIVLIKSAIKRLMLIDGYCKRCGSSRNMVFHVSDKTWKKVTGGSTKEYCWCCFAKMAEQKGIMLTLDEWA